MRNVSPNGLLISLNNHSLLRKVIHQK